MEQPAEQDPERGAAQDRPRPLLEHALHEASYAERLASGDAFVASWFAARVLGKLRRVAPELVRAAEEEVARGD